MEGTISFTCTVMLCWLVIREVAALDCACSGCPSGVCTVLDGGKCYAELFLLDMVQIQPIIRGCYDEASTAQNYCGTDKYYDADNGSYYETYVKIDCCDHKDLCNQELSPTVTTRPPPTIEPKLVCHSYNSKKSDYKSFCESDGGFCYWMVRRNETGNITQWKQGCSKTCEPEHRNRVTRHCCTTSECNKFPPEDELYPTSSSVTIATSSSSYLHQAPPSPVNTEREPTSQPTSAAAARQEMSPYLMASIALGIVYLLIMMVLVMLVAIVCIRQRRLTQTLHEKMSLHSRSTSSTSV